MCVYLGANFLTLSAWPQRSTLLVWYPASEKMPVDLRVVGAEDEERKS